MEIYSDARFGLRVGARDEARDARRSSEIAPRAGGITALAVAYGMLPLRGQFNLLSRWASPAARWAGLVAPAGDLGAELAALIAQEVAVEAPLSPESARWVADFDAADCLFFRDYLRAAFGMLRPPAQRMFTEFALSSRSSSCTINMMFGNRYGTEPDFEAASDLMYSHSYAVPALMTPAIYRTFLYGDGRPGVYFAAVALVLADAKQHHWGQTEVGRAGSSECWCALCAGDYPEYFCNGPVLFSNSQDPRAYGAVLPVGHRTPGDAGDIYSRYGAFPPHGHVPFYDYIVLNELPHIAHAAWALGRLDAWVARVPAMARVALDPEWWGRVGLRRPVLPAEPRRRGAA